jgi:hypothetical protein
LALCYVLVIAGVARAGRPGRAAAPGGDGRWLPRVPGEEPAMPHLHANDPFDWHAALRAWSATDGRGWGLVLTPFIALLVLLRDDSVEQAQPLSTSYTLY